MNFDDFKNIKKNNLFRILLSFIENNSNIKIHENYQKQLASCNNIDFLWNISLMFADSKIVEKYINMSVIKMMSL